jgi:hypothetical protein
MTGLGQNRRSRQWLFTAALPPAAEQPLLQRNQSLLAIAPNRSAILRLRRGLICRRLSVGAGDHVGLLPPPQAALRRLIRRLPLQPALHSRVLADGDVEPQPRRAPEMGTEDRARREHDAVALRRLRQCQRVVDMREARPDEHAVCRLREQLKSDASKAHTTLMRASPSRSCKRDRYLR